MISNIEEYIRLCDSDCRNDNRRTVTEELSQEVVSEILKNHPDRHAWLIHNKLIPANILEVLVENNDEDIRFTIAMKRCCNKLTFEKLVHDKSDSVKLVLVRNPKLPIDLLKKLISDKNKEISKKAKNEFLKRQSQTSR